MAHYFLNPAIDDSTNRAIAGSLNRSTDDSTNLSDVVEEQLSIQISSLTWIEVRLERLKEAAGQLSCEKCEKANKKAAKKGKKRHTEKLKT